MPYIGHRITRLTGKQATSHRAKNNDEGGRRERSNRELRWGSASIFLRRRHRYALLNLWLTCYLIWANLDQHSILPGD